MGYLELIQFIDGCPFLNMPSINWISICQKQKKWSLFILVISPKSPNLHESWAHWVHSFPEHSGCAFLWEDVVCWTHQPCTLKCFSDVLFTQTRDVRWTEIRFGFKKPNHPKIQSCYDCCSCNYVLWCVHHKT